MAEFRIFVLLQLNRQLATFSRSFNSGSIRIEMNLDFLGDIMDLFEN